MDNHARRLRADLAHLRMELAGFHEQIGAFKAIRDTRPLTVDEQAQERGLRRAAERLTLLLQQVSREVRDLQHLQPRGVQRVRLSDHSAVTG